MLEIIGLLVALGGIGTFARGKKISPMLAGSSAFCGWLIIRIAGILARGNDEEVLFMLSAWIWIGLVAGYLRFIVGSGQPKPDIKWNCANCRYLNNSSSLFCEACEHPWQVPATR